MNFDLSYLTYVTGNIRLVMQTKVLDFILVVYVTQTIEQGRKATRIAQSVESSLYIIEKYDEI